MNDQNSTGKVICGPQPVHGYGLGRCIGKGAFGQVHLAAGYADCWCAIKYVFLSPSLDSKAYERESMAVEKFEKQGFNDPGLIRILFVEKDSRGFFCYGMPLADDASENESFDPLTYKAKTLARELRTKGAQPITDTVNVGLSVTSALSTLHRAGFVHGDVKPGNILFVNGQPVLGDPGLFRRIDREAGPTFCGSMGYIAPEGAGTEAADQFASGMVLYEMGTGFDRLEFPKLPVDFFKESLEYARRLNDIILKACDRNPSRRFKSAHAMHEALLALNPSWKAARQGEGQPTANSRGSTECQEAAAKLEKFVRVCPPSWAEASSLALPYRRELVSADGQRIDADQTEENDELRLWLGGVLA